MKYKYYLKRHKTIRSFDYNFFMNTKRQAINLVKLLNDKDRVIAENKGANV